MVALETLRSKTRGTINHRLSSFGAKRIPDGTSGMGVEVPAAPSDARPDLNEPDPARPGLTKPYPNPTLMVMGMLHRAGKQLSGPKQ